MPFDGSGGTHLPLVQVIDRVIELLSSGDRWCQDYINYYDRRCIVGAMAEVHGALSLNMPILHAAEEVTGRPFWRIELFNDDLWTSHALVLRALYRARENIVWGRVGRPSRAQVVFAPRRPRGYQRPAPVADPMTANWDLDIR
jgi:hypothetical protein